MHTELIKRGYISSLVVNRKLSNCEHVIELNSLVELLIKALKSGELNFPLSYRIGVGISNLRKWSIRIMEKTGREVFFSPKTKKILKLINYIPDIIQIHTVHREFDLRILKRWGKKAKIFHHHTNTQIKLYILKKIFF